MSFGSPIDRTEIISYVNITTPRSIYLSWCNRTIETGGIFVYVVLSTKNVKYRENIIFSNNIIPLEISKRKGEINSDVISVIVQ